MGTTRPCWLQQQLASWDMCQWRLDRQAWVQESQESSEEWPSALNASARSTADIRVFCWAKGQNMSLRHSGQEKAHLVRNTVSVSTAAPVSSTRNHQGFQSCRNNLLLRCGVVEACVRCGGVQVEARGLWGVGSRSTLLKQAIYLLFGLLWGTHGWLVHELLDDSPVSNSSRSRSTMIPVPLHPGFFLAGVSGD